MTIIKNVFRVLYILTFVVFTLDFYSVNPDILFALKEVTPLHAFLIMGQFILSFNFFGLFLLYIVEGLSASLALVIIWGNFLLMFVYMYLDYRKWKNKKTRRKMLIRQATLKSQREKRWAQKEFSLNSK